jgi:hypothetical protein
MKTHRSDRTRSLKISVHFFNFKTSAGILEHSMGAKNRVGIGLSYRAGIFKESMGARHRGGRGLSYRPAMLQRLAEFIPRNQFRGPINL